MGVDRTYSDATDGYPALNTIPGVFATKVARKPLNCLPDAYSTTSNLSKHTDDPVDVGVDTTIPYAERDLDTDDITVKTKLRGTKFGSASKLNIFVRIAPLHSEKSDSASATMAELGPGG